MPGLTATFLRHRDCMNEVADALADTDSGRGYNAAMACSNRQALGGERLRRALTELGTTGIKFGQMLSAQRVEQIGQGRLVEGHRGVFPREPG